MKNKLRITIIIYILVAFLFVLFIPIIINNTIENTYNNSSIYNLSYLEDSSIPYKEIETYEDNFIPLRHSHFNKGITRSTYWIRFKLNQQTDPKFIELKNSDIRSINVYYSLNDGSYTIINSGLSKEIDQKRLNASSYIFKTPDNFDFNQYIYIKIKSNALLTFTINVYDDYQLISYLNKENLFYGLFFGILLTILLFNLTVYILIRDSIYLIFLIHLLFLLLYQLRNTGYILPYHTNITYILFSGTLISATIFVKKFLDLKYSIPYMNRFLTAMMGLFALLPILLIQSSSYIPIIIVYLLKLIIPLLLVVISIKSYCQGNDPSKYYLFAWSCILSGVFLYFIFIYFPWISSPYHFVTTGFTLAFTLMSFALLASRMRYLIYEKTKLDKNMRLYHKLSIVDELTGLYNRRKLNDILEVKIKEANKGGGSLSVAMFDLDNFKSINDKFGHPAGDIIIKELAKTIKNNIRETDYAFRYGGEELFLILWNADKLSATYICERIRITFCKKSFDEINYSNTTVSIGVTSCQHNDTPETLIKRSDVALYTSKKEGKNKTCFI